MCYRPLVCTMQALACPVLTPSPTPFLDLFPSSPTPPVIVGRGERGRPSPGPNLFTTEREISFTPEAMEAPSSREPKKNARSHVPSVSDRFLLIHTCMDRPASSNPRGGRHAAAAQLCFSSHPIPLERTPRPTPSGRQIRGYFLFFYAYIRRRPHPTLWLGHGSACRRQPYHRKKTTRPLSRRETNTALPSSCLRPLSPTLEEAESHRSGTFWACLHA
ncbi:hypothetical protein B0T18DRAFT_190769 [Schizothecium vesticola]|uniref:Uncharacterized protein n=1 Tax=Schizothecium vesticola TaxID=314040 RepID=A0AA40EQX9_9PEZI|nr:hypothetical protein B0T18DRAFT_190769 [Schizothecium vesticola]